MLAQSKCEKALKNHLRVKSPIITFRIQLLQARRCFLKY